MVEGNRTRRRLAADDPAIGAWVLSASPRAAEVLAARLDWVGIDCEHSPVGTADVEALVRAVERGDATPIVRLPSVAAAVDGGAKQALDAGAGGVVVPGVETALEAERAVDAARVPPVGSRGVAGTTRANGYGDQFDEYLASANDEVLVAIQIESPTGVENAEDVLAVDGVDVAFVGENDLSAALGHPGETDRPEVREGVERVLGAARANDVTPGIKATSPESVRERFDRGFRFFLLGADLTMLAGVLDDLLDGVSDDTDHPRT
jgi:2-dehydro-3-deoxyglucarate aldolase/4-hydroxy-2-oxoheptanedioate aldolase